MHTSDFLNRAYTTTLEHQGTRSLQLHDSLQPIQNLKMSPMIAYRYSPGSSTLIKERLPLPVPAADEILLKVEAAGLCHSDVSMFILLGMTGT